MIQVKLNTTQFADKAVQLKDEQGIILNGWTGTLSHSGFSASYAYDGETLTITVVKHPFFIPESVVEQHLLAWFAGS